MTDETTAAVASPDAGAPAEASDDALMGAIWDKLNGDAAPSEAPEEEAPAEDAAEDATAEEAEAEAPEPEAEAQPEIAPPPSDLPAAIKDAWKDIPEAARDAFVRSQRDMSAKLADAGRVAKAAKPTFDVLVRAAKEIPTLANMTPEAIAEDVFRMAQIQDSLARDPVRTLLGVANDYGALDALKQAFATGQVPQPQAPQRPAVDPKQIETMAEAAARRALAQSESERLVQTFATGREHWSEVEPLIPSLIPAARRTLGESASAQDVLDRAYDMAVHAHPELRAKVMQAPQQAPATPDPAKVEAARKAKSVNVTSRTNGKPKPMTERQAMEAVWDRHMQS